MRQRQPRSSGIGLKRLPHREFGDTGHGMNRTNRPLCETPTDGGISNEQGWTLCATCTNGPDLVWHKTEDIRAYLTPEAAAKRAAERRALRMAATPENIGKRVARLEFEKRGNPSKAHFSEVDLAALVARAIELYHGEAQGKPMGKARDTAVEALLAVASGRD